MKTHGLFIGVTSYADPDISDLPCATRDARALWALFLDSTPGINATLLVDADANQSAVRRALVNLLSSAGPDDSVIISFSGHGTYDQALVLSDSLLSGLESTCISTLELAELFRSSPAKSVLLILDCCFSGSTPARVIGVPSKAKSLASPFQVLCGSGRAIIAASAETQEAYESSLLGHGLLTHAVVQTLSALSVVTPLSQVLEEVVSRVISSASSIYKTQTPVMVLHAQGGLTIGPFQKGAHFACWFPDLSGVTISGAVEELAAFGFNQHILGVWANRFPGGLNALQTDAVNQGLLRGEQLLVVAPTSSGKTFIGELAAMKAAIEGRKSVFLVPYRALANDHFEQFTRAYTPLGHRIIRCTGDFSDQMGLFIGGKYDIAVLTYEMFLGAVTRHRWLLERLGLVVVDEAHFLADPNRGIIVELIFTILQSAKTRGVCPQTISLSAVVDQLAGFDVWLGATALIRTERPVPLQEGVVDCSGTWVWNNGGVATSEAAVRRSDVVQRRDKPSSQDLLVPLVLSLVRRGDKVVVFRNNKGSTQGCAAYLAKDLALPPASEALANLPTHDLSSASEHLRVCLQGGTAFHNTNLSAAERTVVEAAFRDRTSPLRVLVATSTVAAGVNLPAEDVIIVEHEIAGPGDQRFTVAQYKNMAGRAGRTGLVKAGRSFLIAEGTMEAQQLYREYVIGRLEPLRSSFKDGDLDTWIIRLLTQVGVIPEADVATLLINTFAGFQFSRKNPGWSVALRQRTDPLISEMKRLQLVETEPDGIRLSLLGRACGESPMSLKSCMRLISAINGRNDVSAVGLLVVCQSLPELDGVHTPIAKGASERLWTTECGSIWPPAPLVLQRGASDDREYFARCKRTCVMGSWTAGHSMSDIESAFTKNPFSPIDHGFVLGCAQSTRFFLRSAYAIAATANPALATIAEDIEVLLLQLEFGLPATLLDLARLSLRLSRGELLACSRAGIFTPADLHSADRTRVKPLLSSRSFVGYEQWKSRPL